MPVKLLTASSGSVTLDAANTASNFTVTIPAVTATMLNNQSDITAQVKTATNASGDAPIYSCRAWVNFNGTGTVAIRASGNVSSIGDVATGNYNVNFTTAMPNTNYCVNVSAHKQGTYEETPYYNTTLSTSSVNVFNVTVGGTFIDTTSMSVAIFR